MTSKSLIFLVFISTISNFNQFYKFYIKNKLILTILQKNIIVTSIKSKKSI